MMLFEWLYSSLNPLITSSFSLSFSAFHQVIPLLICIKEAILWYGSLPRDWAFSSKFNSWAFLYFSSFIFSFSCFLSFSKFCIKSSLVSLIWCLFLVIVLLGSFSSIFCSSLVMALIASMLLFIISISSILFF